LELGNRVLAVLHFWKRERLVGVPQPVDQQRAILITRAGNLQPDALAGRALVLRDARRQQGVVEEVPGDRRQRFDLIARDDGREIRFRRLDDRGLSRDGQRLAERRQLHRDVQIDRAPNLQRQIIVHKLREAFELRGHRVFPRIQPGKPIDALVVGDDGARLIGGLIRNCDDDARHHAAGDIADSARDTRR
jgi:hypothetical protein